MFALGDRRGGIVRAVAELAAGDEALDVAGGSAFGLGDPLALGALGRDAGELADCGPMELAALQAISQLRQLFQGEGDSEALLGLPAGPAEEPLRVLAEGAV